jgi:hypothetical protein
MAGLVYTETVLVKHPNPNMEIKIMDDRPLSKKQLKEQLKLLDPRNQLAMIEDDGEFLRVQFVRKNGEVVIGRYQRCGWALPPKKVAAKFNKMITAPPKRIYR